MKKKIAELRNTLRSIAKAGGCEMRHTLLALALLRGMPYRLLELTTRRDHAPSPSLLAETAERPVLEVKEWLAAPATPELLERFKVAREAGIAAKRARTLSLQISRAS